MLIKPMVKKMKMTINLAKRKGDGDEPCKKRRGGMYWELTVHVYTLYVHTLHGLYTRHCTYCQVCTQFSRHTGRRTQKGRYKGLGGHKRGGEGQTQVQPGFLESEVHMKWRS